MTDPIDYSRPVGWWCAYCNEHFPCERARMWLSMACNLIPRYLPIPEGQRPLVDDEVEIAEVVTIDVGRIAYCCGSAGTRWTTEPTVEYINYIVTGATE